jgi:large subunit ribosomal protein L13
MAATTRAIFSSALVRRPVWHLVDASEHILGRLATQIAMVISGKHKPCWEPSMDCGDYVVVINADRIQLSHPNKWQHKKYRWHTGWPGGLKEVTAQRMLDTHPERILEAAVSGMLPKNRLRDDRMRKLRLFSGTEHPHQPQIDDPINRQLLDSLNIDWKKSRPANVDPLTNMHFHPGWMLHFEQDGDFMVAHAMKMKPKPSSRAEIRKWQPSQQLPAFETAVQKYYTRKERRLRSSSDPGLPPAPGSTPSP